MSIPRFPNRQATQMRPHQWRSAPVVGIRSLPPELMLHIFQDVLGPTTFGNIDLEYEDREWVELCLSNSKGMGLHLQFHAEYFEYGQGDYILIRGFGGQPRFTPGHEVSVVLPLNHAQRIQSVWVSGEKAVAQLGKLRDLFKLPLPRLEELRVTMGAQSIQNKHVLTEFLNIDSRRLPALRTLVLDGIYLPWSSSILRNLRALKLVYASTNNHRYRMTLHQFLNALGACQALQYLSLYMSTPMDGWRWDTTSSPGDTIALPNLRFVDITSLGSDRDDDHEEHMNDMFPILAHVRFPEHCYIKLGSESEQPYRYIQLVPNDAQCFPILRSATEAVWEGRARFRCRTGPPYGGSTRGELVVDVDSTYLWEYPLLTYRNGRQGVHPDAYRLSTNPEGALAAFCSYLSRARLTKLTMQYSELISVDAYLSAFRVFPHLEELVLDYRQQQRAFSQEEIRRVLHALTEQIGLSPDAPATRTVEVPLPNLRILRFRDVFWYNELPNHVQQCQWARQSHGAAPLQVDFGRPRM
ncbi:hypothetical protein BD309DRAFT_1003235 [Dichomitus squalens]|nr:hypothetical protein BD309DRAFT_1003235 [Dichomitus squalens]